MNGTASAQSTWWDSDWNRRAPVVITEISGSTLIDFQIKVEVPYDSDMQPDFDDVRFVENNSASVLSYWCENYTAGDKATFWVKVPNIPASGTRTIWMYYGNPAVATTSNIHNTFIWGDDFEDETWTNNNLNKANLSENCTQYVLNGEYHLEGEASTEVPNPNEPIAEIYEPGLTGLKQFPDNYIAETDVKGFLNTAGNQTGGAFITPKYLNVEEKYEHVLDFQHNNAVLNKVVGDQWTNLGTSYLGYQVEIDQSYKLKAVVLWEVSTNRLKVFINNEIYLDGTDSDLLYDGLAFLGYDWNEAFHVSYDNFRVREYASQEPTTWIGWEERVDGIPQWWDIAWNRRAPVVMTETSGSTLTDYQVEIVVPYDSDMQPDFDDVRFVGEASNELSYWRDSYTAGDTATFWVKVPNISASGTQTIWMYYGNPVVATSSDIHRAFIWGDDFEDITWTNNNVDALNFGDSWQYVLNGEYHMGGSSSSEPIARIYEWGALKQFAANYIAEVDVKPAIKAGGAYITPRYHSIYGMYECALDVQYNNAVLSKLVNGSWTDIDTSPLGYQIETGQWYKLKAVLRGDVLPYTLQVFVNNELHASGNDSDLSYNGLAFLSYDWDEAGHIIYDNFRVRQYASQEPIISISPEESPTPAVTTDAATDVTTNSATINGTLTSLGTASSVQVSFEWGLTDAYGSETTPQTLTATGPFTAPLDSLTPGTTYHFRAKAVGDGEAYGNDTIFNTTTNLPAVTTDAATDVTTNSATLNGNLSDLGNATTVDVSFEWGLTDSYGSETTPQTVGATGVFSAPLNSLTPGTTYHFRAKAVGDGTALGSDMEFTTLVTLTVNIVGSGSVAKVPDQATYTYGTNVQLTATADPGWTFSAWSGDLTGSVNPDNITMDGAKTVTATFTQDQYTLTVNIVGSGLAAKVPDQATYTYGTNVQLTATADPGWTFSAWSGDLTGSVNPDNITMDGDKTVTATFTQDQYTLTVNIAGSGSVAKVPDQATYTYGTNVQLTATADLGWTFSAWSGNLTGSVNPDNITMDGDKTVTATFTQDQYTLTVNIAGSG